MARKPPRLGDQFSGHFAKGRWNGFACAELLESSKGTIYSGNVMSPPLFRDQTYLETRGSN